jgi:hypothetical protein
MPRLDTLTANERGADHSQKRDGAMTNTDIKKTARRVLEES